jgi:hypothetical protein
MIKSMLLRTGRSELGHPDEVLAVHERILAVSPAQGRDIKVGSGRRVHVIEAGKGPPVVLLHGSSTSSLLLLPLLERLKGLRGIVVDRPGFGLSDPRRRFPRALPRRCSRVPGRGSRRAGVGHTRACGQLHGWDLGPVVRPGPPRSRSSARAARCGPAVARHSCPATLASDGHIRSRGAAGALDQTQPEAGRSDDDLDGREGHHQQLPGPDRGARRGGQRPGRLRGQPRRAPGGHLALRVPTSVAGAARRAAATHRADVVGKGRSRPHRSGQGRQGDRQTAPQRPARGAACGSCAGSATPTEQPNSFPRLSVEFTGGEVPGFKICRRRIMAAQETTITRLEGT